VFKGNIFLRQATSQQECSHICLFLFFLCEWRATNKKELNILEKKERLSYTNPFFFRLENLYHTALKKKMPQLILKKWKKRKDDYISSFF